MTMTIVLNAILGVGAIVVVVAPLVWSIVTQHRDHPRIALADGATALPRHGAERRRRTMAPPGGVERRSTSRTQYKPAIGSV